MDMMKMGAHKPKCMADGGKVRGKGTGASDSIPAMLSKGEFVMPADTVKHFGVKTLETMRKATHKPMHPDAEGKKEDMREPKGMEKREMMKGRGAIRKMADGGLVDDKDKAVFGLYPQLAGGKRTSYATDNALRSGVVATGPASFGPALQPADKPVTLAPGVTPSAAGAGRGVVNPALAVATVPESPTALQPAAPATAAALPAPAAMNVTDASGKVNSFTDGTQPALGARGPISAQNMAAGDNLSARYGAEAQGAIAKTAYDQQVADAAATNRAGGFGTGQPALAPRESLLAQLGARKLTAAGARVMSGLAGNDVTAADAAGTRQLATQRLALDTQTHSQDAAVKGGQIRLAAQTEAARAAWLAAKPGSPERVAAEETLRVLQGKAEKTPTPPRQLVVPGGQVLNEMGQPVTQPSMVFDPDSGKFLQPPGAQTAAPAGAAGATTKAQYDALPKGARYTGPDGKPYIKG